MIRGLVIRPAQDGDREAIRLVLDAAFEGPAEGELVRRLVADRDVVLELVATHETEVVGHILFSRLRVEEGRNRFDAVALAPLAVAPTSQRTKIGATLVENGHHMLQEAGERLSVVLGDPRYYGRFGYSHGRAAGFASDYQCDALQALAWGEAPSGGRLVYAPAFSAL